MRRGIASVLALLTIVTVGITALRLVRRDSDLHVRWDFRHLQLGRYEERRIRFSRMLPATPGSPPVPGNHSSVAKGYHVGPLTVYKWWVEDGPDPVGTNALAVGDRLFDPTTKRELWKVLGVELQHEFEDGTEREGVRVRDAVNGGEAWVPRTNLSKALVSQGLRR